jgi:hypothetical protein
LDGVFKDRDDFCDAIRGTRTTYPIVTTESLNLSATVGSLEAASENGKYKMCTKCPSQSQSPPERVHAVDWTKIPWQGKEGEQYEPLGP